MVLGKVAITLGRIAGITAFSLLTACGGGGGGSSGGGGSTTPPPTTSGLIPTAPTLGATLVADATTLRPMIDSASWAYTGTDTVGSNSPISYSSVVKQSASGSGFTEAATNAFNGGADSASISASSGSVNSTNSLSLSGTTAQLLTFPELRSPVRQNDQTTILDQHFADLGVDADGDGKNESGDVAIYRVVVGMEDVALPGIGTVHAVRVDMIAKIRVVPSKTGKALDPIQAALQSTWYAANLGIVKQRLTTPATETSNEVAEEVLSYFDGVTRGAGAMSATQLKIGADGGSYAGLSMLSLDWVLPFPDHVLVGGTVMDPQNPSVPKVVSNLSLRGSSTHTTTIDMATSIGTPMALNGRMSAWTSLPSCSIGLAPFDAGGTPTGGLSTQITIAPSPAAVGTSLCASLSTTAIAADGSRFWLAAVRATVSTSGWITDLIVQPFDASGTPIATATVLASVNGLQSWGPSFGIKSLTAVNGKALVRYASDASAGTHLALVGDTGVIATNTLAPTSWGEPTPVCVNGACALLWQSAVPNTSPQQFAVRGVWLDANLVPVLAGSGGLDAQALLPALTTKGSTQFFAGPDNSLLVASYDGDTYTGRTPVVTLARYRSDAGPLAAQTPTPITVDLSDLRNLSPSAMTVSPKIALYPDRALLFFNGSGGGFLKAVWLP